MALAPEDLVKGTKLLNNIGIIFNSGGLNYERALILYFAPAKNYARSGLKYTYVAIKLKPYGYNNNNKHQTIN